MRAGSPTLMSVPEMVHAAEHGQLHLEYQLICNLRTGALTAAEALVRWMHPRQGRIGPLSFIHMLDDGAVGVVLANEILDQAIARAALWARAGIELNVCVNVAPATLPAVPGIVSDRLAFHGLAPHLLTIEVTERRSSIDMEATRSALQALAHLGVRISLDDFGVGEASLSRLQLFHFDEIKIDQSFVRQIVDDPTDRKICEFVTSLAHGLGIQVIAEGVETEEILAVVESIGVDLAQGYFIHRPTSPESVQDLLLPSGSSRPCQA